METLTQRGEQIVNVAIKLLSERGIIALTIKNLAKSVGVTEPALYRHFKSKLDILVAILDRLETNMYKLFEQSANNKDSILDQIQTVYGRVFRSFVAQPALASVIFSEELFRHDPRLSERVGHIMNTVEESILTLLRSKKGQAECRRDVPAEDLARVIMGTFRFLVTRWRLNGYTFDLEKEGTALWQSLRLMIAVPTALSTYSERRTS